MSDRSKKGKHHVEVVVDVDEEKKRCLGDHPISPELS